MLTRPLPLLVLWASIEGRFTNKRDKILPLPWLVL